MKRIKQLVLVLPSSLSVLLLPLVLAGCIVNSPPSGPDVIYAKNSGEAKQLQVPPDLTNVSKGEQFILPGSEPGPLARNRLLPTITGAQYIRSGDQNWLEFSQAAESIWPMVLEFVSKERWTVERTAPTSGLILTQWRSDNEKSGGLLKNLISGDELFSRVAFRLERNGSGTRLFARSMQLSGDAIEQDGSDDWPASSHDPEAVSALLAKLLVFFGTEEQKARGILSEPQAKAVLDDAHLQTTAAGSQLVVHKAFAPSFNQVKAAFDQLPYKVLLTDGSVGTIQFSTGNDEQPLLASLTPLHLSAVQVQITKAGARIDRETELAILRAIQEKFS